MSKKIKITTTKGTENVNIENVAKTGQFTGNNGIYLKIQYKGFREETIIGPFASEASATEAEDQVNP